MSILKEAALVDMSDDELKELLGHTYHAIKNIDEDKKNDPDLAQMRDQLKAYIKDCYDDQLTDLKKRMKAARALAKARGIRWECPADEGYKAKKFKDAVDFLRNPDGKGETKVFVGFAGEPLVQVGGPKE